MRGSRSQVVPAFLMLGLAAGCGVATQRDTGSTPPGTPPPVVCADPNDEEHCALELKDSHLRTTVPAAQAGDPLDQAVVEVYHRARDAGCLEELDRAGRCAGPSEMTATRKYVARVEQSLTRAGYPDAVVRLARPEDPTAPGALIWAVRVGDVCVFGDVTPPPAERTHFWHAGLLAGGRCLTA